MSVTDSAQATRFLNSLRLHGIHPSLENIRLLVSHMGNPQQDFESIQIVGSNGKGSTAAILAASLSARQNDTGLYTSPHLTDLRERVLFQGKMLSLDSWLLALNEVESVMLSHSIPITFFEAVTAAAFFLFRKEKARTVVLEAGMGGRWDATSVALPIAAVLTSISLEHTRILGNTTEAILSEKVAVGREGTPFVAKLSDDLVEPFFQLGKRQGFRPLLWGKDFSTRWISPFSKTRYFLYEGLSKKMELPVSLTADYQIGNIGLALATLEVLDRFPEEKALANALISVRHSGRWEHIRDNPDIYLDGAHNPEASQALVQTIGSSFGPEKKVIFLFGILEDKNWKEVLGTILPVAEAIFLTIPPSDRAVLPEELLSWIRSYDLSIPVLSGSLDKMLDQSLVQAKHLALPLVVSGSLYLVGAVKQQLTGIRPELTIGEHTVETPPLS